MKKIVILICLCLSTLLASSQTKNLTDTSSGIAYKDYVGKEVYQLLLNDNIRCYKSFTFLSARPFVLAGAIIELSNDVYFEIYIPKFQFLTPFSEKVKWDKTLFYKEIIGRIRVYRNEVCILDTENP